ncbi:hypothetical protein ACYF6T_06045 [Streptomyces sp. 7R007]
MTATLSLMVWGASSAAAGGPTSVLVTSPTGAKATALYYSDKEYDALQGLLGAPGVGTREKPPEADLAHARQINVTWMAHDMTPWRIDRVFPVDSRPRAVWIHTAADVSQTPNGYWHRADDPDRLRTLLKKLGVMGRASANGYPGIFPAPWQSAGTDTAASPDADAGTATVAAGTAATDTGTDWWANWWWAVPGLVVGVAAGAGGAGLIRRAAARQGAGPPPDEPRQELVDL